MARIRSVKPELWSDQELATLLSRDARLLYIALWNQADEHSRCHGDPRWVKGHCFPYDDDLDAAAVDGLLTELAVAGKVVRYVARSVPYLFLPNLDKHQRLDTKVESKLPSPEDSEVVQINPHESAPDAEKKPLSYVAGSMEHVPPTVSAPNNDADKSASTLTQRSKAITDAYAVAEPMCKWPAVNGIVIKALKAERWADGEVREALLRMAGEKRTVTVDSLRVELDGLPPRHSGGSARKQEGDRILRDAMRQATGST
jgi:hypothetical protein